MFDEKLHEFDWPFISLFLINQQRDRCEMLAEYMSVVKHGTIHVVRNRFFGMAPSLFELYEMPKAIPVHWSDLILGQHDCVLVKMRGVVRAADLVLSSRAPISTITIQMLTDGGYVEVTIDSDNLEALNGLLDAEVEVTGAAGGKFDDKMQQTGIVLHVPSLKYIKILKPANLSVWNTPVTPMSQILGGYRVNDLTSRIRVQGTITYYHPGSVVVLESGGRSLWIRTGTDQPLRLGDYADAIDKWNVWLLAGNYVGGNSGYPVFLLPTLPAAHRVMLIGIIAGAIARGGSGADGAGRGCVCDHSGALPERESLPRAHDGDDHETDMLPPVRTAIPGKTKKEPQQRWGR